MILRWSKWILKLHSFMARSCRRSSSSNPQSLLITQGESVNSSKPCTASSRLLECGMRHSLTSYAYEFDGIETRERYTSTSAVTSKRSLNNSVPEETVVVVGVTLVPGDGREVAHRFSRHQGIPRERPSSPYRLPPPTILFHFSNLLTSG